MEILVWGIIFIMEVMNYILGEKIFFERTIKRKWAGIIGFLVYMCIVASMHISQKEDSVLIMYGLAMVTAYIMVYRKIIEDFVHILILFIEVSCIEGITEKVIGAILQSTGCFNITKESLLLISGVVIIILFLIVYIFCKRKKISETKIRIEYIWIPVLSMIINILLMAAGLEVAKEYVSNQRVQYVMSILNTSSYISVGLVVFFITYIRNTNKKLQQLLMVEKQLKDAQKQYYNTLLQKEEETRKNRHDWNNHLMCLAELAQNENADNTKQYIESLIKQSVRLKDKQYDVGNDVLNAILCCHLSELDDDISVKIMGKCRNDMNIGAVDLCVIVSNLVQNAVEYLRDSSIETKELSVSIEEGNVYKRISVVNSVDKNVSERTLKTTTKLDKRNHGIGLRNVRETIERNGGKLEINIRKGMFRADVIWN